MKLTRRQLLASALGGIATAQTRPPNIILILADDLGWADTTPYGSDLHETPNLQRLASEGVRFTQAYAAAPVCSPTRASIMTGKFPARLHITIWHEAAAKPPKNRAVVPPIAEGNLPHSEITLAEVLKDRGYLTAHVGKWHLGTAGYYPETQGFDVNIGGTFWGAPQTFFYPYRGNKRFGGEYRYVPHLELGKPGEYLTDRLTDEALQVIEKAGTQPYFLNLWYHSVHTPIEGKPEYVKHFEGKLNENLNHRNPQYAAMVRSLDENVGRILQRAGDNTLVVFASDNGGFINEYEGRAVTNNSPLRSGKGSLYEGGIRIPLMIRGPGVAKGAVCEVPVVTNDLYPTLIQAAGGNDPGKHDGLSLWELLRNPKSKLNREEFFFHYPHYYATTSPVSAVRSGNWKLLEYLEDGRLELYDLAADPSEKQNLANSNAAKARDLKARLDAWRTAVNAQMPTRRDPSR